MTNNLDTASAATASLYGREYYESYTIDERVGYSRENWLRDFGNIADQIVSRLNPASVLDVGCAKGFLVECLRDRGVDAFGVDISNYAISEVREDIAPYCWVGSAASSITRDYDLIVCNEVCEHLPEPEAKEAIRQMALHTRTILFSSTPGHFEDPTHINVRPIIDWLRLFGTSSFVPDERFDAGFLGGWAMLLRRSENRPSDERLRRFAHVKTTAFVAWELKYSPGIRDELEGILNSKAWRAVCLYRTLRGRLKSTASFLRRGVRR